MKRILIVEDDGAIAAIERDYLMLSDFQVDIAATGPEGLAMGRSGGYDLILLDLMLPGLDGFALCSTLRETLDIPILMVTARQEDIDKIKGLGLGADDYITKPFRIRELTSRIRSVLRRAGQGGSTLMEFGPVQINAALGKVYKNGQDVFLSALEYRLLMTLANHAGQVLSRNQLLESIWDVSGDFVNDNTLTVYIKRLREKIEDDPQNPVIIETVRGLGYRVGGRR